ncbi:MAG: PQQ-dependent sugar dehydrogenase [bacterium]|nr:PQQ-dependent sugar dehydrogenase [bacterium]
MSRILLAVFLFSAGPLLAGGAVELEPVASGFERPLGLVNAGDGTNRLFVVERAGRVHVIEDRAVRRRPFLDIRDRVTCCQGGHGLLGLAFHPDHESNGYFFVHYSDLSGDSVIARFSVSNADPNRARAGSELRILAIPQTTAGHTGGDLAFGPDGYLYVASGDGSNGGDPDNNAQSLGRPLGKILRLDVDGGPGAVPSDNPFVGESGARDDIWAYGLRNPWRISFDRLTGDLFIADVGQNRIEEVDFQAAASPGGQNYGWRRMEGSACFEPPSDCDADNLVSPILEYGHDLGCSVTGGYRYRGSRGPTLVGHYLFGDYCSGVIWGAEPNRDGVWISRVLAETDLRLVTFGEDEEGELYVVDFRGAVHRVVSREVFASGFESGSFAGWTRKGPVEIVAPGLAGSGFALAIPAADGRERFVRTRATQRSTDLEVSFFAETSGLDLAGGQADALTLSDGRGVHLRLALEQISRKRYRAALWVSEGSAGERLVGRMRFKTRSAVQLAVEWRSASSPSSRDGVARLSKNGSVRASAENMATGVRFAGALKLGLPGGTPPASSGRLLLDGVSLRR